MGIKKPFHKVMVGRASCPPILDSTEKHGRDARATRNSDNLEDL